MNLLCKGLSPGVDGVQRLWVNFPAPRFSQSQLPYFLSMQTSASGPHSKNNASLFCMFTS